MGALGLPLLRLVEPCILECDGGMSCQNVEQPDVVVVELPDSELGDDDHAEDTAAEVERNRDHRLLDRLGSFDLDGELALGRVG